MRPLRKDKSDKKSKRGETIDDRRRNAPRTRGTERPEAPPEAAPPETPEEPGIEADVVVFGAGITGLTVAHELVERNFAVVVVDPTYCGERPQYPYAEDENPGVGGVAASQWGFLPNDSLVKDEMQRPATGNAEMTRTDRRPPGRMLLIKYALVNEGNDMRLARLEEASDFCSQQPRGALAQAADPILGHLAHGYRLTANIALASSDPKKEEKLVYQAIVEALSPKFEAIRDGVPNSEDKTIEDYVRLETGALEGQPSGTVALGLNLFALPGEHGFRFFPSFYRHIFDTMKRIPLTEPMVNQYGDNARAGRATVYDNLVPVDNTAYVGSGDMLSAQFPRRPLTSMNEIRKITKDFIQASGLTESDLGHLSRGFLKYATSSRRRRETEYEDMSWYEFLQGDRLSDQGRFLMETTPGTMLALSGSDGDARSHGTIGLQCMADNIKAGEKTDSLLNGPTDAAWLGPWYRYLEAQGVTFLRAKVKELEWREGVLEPIVEWVGPAPYLGNAQGQGPEGKTVQFAQAGDRAIYYVMALPFLEAYSLVHGALQEHPKEVERSRDFGALCDFSGAASPAELGEALYEPYPKIGPLRHLSGIQFFFNQDMRLWRAHTQYVQAPAGLTAVAQPQFWIESRDILSGYRSVLSVDIGIWAQPLKENKAVVGTSALMSDYGWNLDADEIARLVWKQIEDGHKADFARDWIAPPKPFVYHIDDNLAFAPARGGGGEPAAIATKATLTGNRTAFLVNQKGRYRRRPGAAGPAGPPDFRAEIAYEVAYDQFVLAGIYMQTYTRINSMEAACESGRHAVNAILQAMIYPGERCETWDPEDYEPQSLATAKEIDQRLCARGLPHMLDIL